MFPCVESRVNHLTAAFGSALRAFFRPPAPDDFTGLPRMNKVNKFQQKLRLSEEAVESHKPLWPIAFQRGELPAACILTESASRQTTRLVNATRFALRERHTCWCEGSHGSRNPSGTPACPLSRKGFPVPPHRAFWTLAPTSCRMRGAPKSLRILPSFGALGHSQPCSTLAAADCDSHSSWQLSTRDPPLAPPTHATCPVCTIPSTGSPNTRYMSFLYSMAHIVRVACVYKPSRGCIGHTGHIAEVETHSGFLSLSFRSKGVNRNS